MNDDQAFRAEQRVLLGGSAWDDEDPNRDASDYSEDDECAGGVNMRGEGEGNYIDNRGVRHLGALQHSKLDARMDKPPPTMDEDDGGAKTGVKGVLDDYKRAQMNADKLKMRERIAAQRAQHRMAFGASQLQLAVGDSDAPPTRPMNQWGSESAAGPSKKAAAADEGSDSDFFSDDDDDEEAFRQYRANTMAAVANALPTFGSYERVSTVQEFAHLTKTTHELIYVVCHLYQNHIEPCVKLHFALEALATAFDHVCFVRLRAKDAKKGMSDLGLPTLLVYKGGECVDTIMRAHEQVIAAADDDAAATSAAATAVGATDTTTGRSGDFTDKELAQFLSSKGILRMPAAWNHRAGGPRSTRANRFDDDDVAVGGGSGGGGGEAQISLPALANEVELMSVNE
jgi:hypothetical protein